MVKEKNLNTPYKPLICPKCGSSDVIRLFWVNPNTGEIEWFTSAGREDLIDYCYNCKDTIQLIEG